MKTKYKLLAMLSLYGLVPSCSMKITMPDGSVTYLGAVNLREGKAGDLPFVHSRRLGVMVDAGVSNNGIALGYDDRLMVKPPDEAVTTIDYQSGAHLDLQMKHSE